MTCDSSTQLLAAVRGRFNGFPGFILEESKSRRWASVTFSGQRHELAFRLEGEGADTEAERFVGGLDPRNFPLKGHLLADLALVTEERGPYRARLRITALTVEDR